MYCYTECINRYWFPVLYIVLCYDLFVDDFTSRLGGEGGEVVIQPGFVLVTNKCNLWAYSYRQ